MPEKEAEVYKLTVTRHIAASPEKVWDAMVNRQEDWWCPAPWHAETIQQDWKAGGRSAMMFRGPDGEEMLQEGIFIDVTPGRRFVTTDALIVDAETGDLRPANPFMVGIWEVEAENGGTRYTGTARHWTKEAYDQHKAMGFEDGWGACADQLAGLCEGEG